jgi:hypothetical protein
MVDVNQSERDALVVRGYLTEGERGSGAERRSRPCSPISSWTYNRKPLSAVELASDWQIRRNASQVEEQFHRLRVTAATHRGAMEEFGSYEARRLRFKGPHGGATWIKAGVFDGRGIPHRTHGGLRFVELWPGAGHDAVEKFKPTVGSGMFSPCCRWRASHRRPTQSDNHIHRKI